MGGDDHKIGRGEGPQIQAGVIIHVTDQGATSPDPIPCDLDLEPASALGGGSSTRSNTASTSQPDADDGS